MTFRLSNGEYTTFSKITPQLVKKAIEEDLVRRSGIEYDQQALGEGQIKPVGLQNRPVQMEYICLSYENAPAPLSQGKMGLGTNFSF